MTVEYVIFDWAGTLTPWHTVDLPGIWQETAASLDGVGAREAPEVGERLLRAEAELMARCRETQCSARLDEVFERAGVTPTPRALSAYQQAWEAHTLIDPQAPETLEGLRERGLGIGVLSNTLWPADWHDEIFERDGVLGHVDATVYSSEVAWTKPHPDIFAAMVAKLGAVSAGACAFVGDRAFEDVYGAQQAGMRTILVPHSSIPEQELGTRDAMPDAVVRTLKDVLTVVDDWNRPER
ncbi:HAD family hydrolase [Streptomyces sp. SID12501]|uniref:HAD family hydrolase n=1 Tax=Streptomyces sp. SID12501 TaxID=2706042 RepID=A0A6B3BVT1_9ACTN|nr:HAD family hydrolase [Streptomyces sp. SID12501]NEC88380.1 HAD family hydrolase [Streptomyces sp. SID12501]